MNKEIDFVVNFKTSEKIDPKKFALGNFLQKMKCLNR